MAPSVLCRFHTKCFGFSESVFYFTKKYLFYLYLKSLFRPRTFLTTCNTFSRTHCSYRNTQYGHITTLTKAKISLLLLRHLGEGSEGEGALDLAHVVLQDGVG